MHRLSKVIIYLQSLDSSQGGNQKYSASLQAKNVDFLAVHPKFSHVISWFGCLMQEFAITALLISYPSCVLWFLGFTCNFDKHMDFTNSLLKSILLSYLWAFLLINPNHLNVKATWKPRCKSQWQSKARLSLPIKKHSVICLAEVTTSAQKGCSKQATSECQ